MIWRTTYWHYFLWLTLWHSIHNSGQVCLDGIIVGETKCGNDNLVTTPSLSVPQVCWNGHFGQNWLWWPLASQEVSSSCMYSVKSMFNCGVGWRPTTVWSLCRIAQTLPTNWRRTFHVMWTRKSRMLWLSLCHRQVQIHCHLQRALRLKLYQSDGTRRELHRRIFTAPATTNRNVSALVASLSSPFPYWLVCPDLE